MQRPLSKLLLMITMLIAFVGQTMAYHFMASYDSSFEQHIEIPQKTIINDNSSANPSESIDDCCEVECCESDCICPANACASIAYLDSRLLLSDIMVLSEPLLSLATKDTYFIASPFYRPPIFTS